MSLVAIIKGLVSLWPFVREMFFAGKSFKEVVMANKLVCCLLFVLAVSIAINYMSLGKIYDIAVARREERGAQGANKPPDNPTSTTGAPPPHPSASVPDHYTRALEQLKEIYPENP